MMSAGPLRAAGDYIDITFGARGEVTTVTNVTVENLSTGATVTLGGSDILRLGDGTTAVGNISTELTRPLIYPNPAYGDGTLAFDAQGGDVAVQIYSADGRLVAARSFDDVTPGRHAISLPACAAGQYVVRFQANGTEEGLTWLCVGAGSNGQIALDKVNADQAKLPVRKSAARTAAANVVPMVYTVGDLLRFTGENGHRRTIVMNQPTCDHDILFDLYECKDANGNYYTCVRAGDMLWMAEDLRPLSNITGLAVTSDPSVWSAADDSTPMEFLANGAAYFNLAAISKIEPEGWHVPTAGEADYLVNKLGNYNTVGNLLKSRDFDWAMPVDGLDSVSFGAIPTGWIDHTGTLREQTLKSCWLTSSTMNRGKVVSMEIQTLNNKVFSPVPHTHNGYGFAVRFCRTVASPYQQMMEFFNLAANEASARQQAPARQTPPFRFVNDGPLGSHYEQASPRTSVWYNYTGRQYGVTDSENRSGCLYKETDRAGWSHHSKAIIPYRSSEPQSVLRKMAAQTRANGYQTCLEAQWSRPFRLFLDAEYSTNLPTTPAVCGAGTVAIREMGDLPSGFAAGAPRNLLAQDGSDYQFYMPTYNNTQKLKVYHYHDSDRDSEVPIAYTIASFNVKCIRDITGDGIDEIVTAIGQEICVFDGASYRMIYCKNFNGTGTASYLGFCQIRIEVADVDNDGWEDIVALVADGASSCHLNIYRSGNLNQAPMFSLDGVNGVTIPTYGFLNDVKVGHVCGQTFPEICLQTRGLEVVDGNETTAWNSFLYIYRLQPVDTGNGTTYNLQTVVNGAEIYGYRASQHDNVHDGVVGNTNLCIAYLRGSAYNPDLIVADGLWRCDPDRTVPTYRFQILPSVKNSHYSIYPDQLVACDAQGNGKDLLVYFRTWNTYETFSGKYGVHMGRQWMRMGSVCETWLSNASSTSPSNNMNISHQLAGYGNSGSAWSDNTGWEMISQYEVRTEGYSERNSNCAMATVRDRERAIRYDYVGYQRTYSEPRIYALLAAAPYYKNYSEPGSTTWGKAFSTSDATCRTNSYQPTIIAGYNHEITFPVLGTKLGEVDVTAKFKMDFQDSYETSSTTSFGESHGATDDDRVIMQVSPYDTYTYRIIASDNPDEIGGLIQISSPLPRMFLGLTLDDYTRMTADQKNVPNLSGYFQHIPGQPFTYPSDELMIHSQAANPCFMWGRDASNNTAVVSCGAGGFTSRSISMQNDTTTSNSQSYGFELELVVTLGNVKAGAGFGYNHTNETSHTVSETHEVSAQVNGLPSANDAEHPMFRWNFVWYKESLNGQEFPVIQYMVKR